jgi:hypothetical protein
MKRTFHVKRISYDPGRVRRSLGDFPSDSMTSPVYPKAAG